MSFSIPSVLTIAGSDSSGGAGIQADIKSITACGCFAQSAIAAITAQNTLGVSEVFNIPTSTLVSQVEAVFADIRPDAVKVGMLSTAENMLAVADALERLQAQKVVVDPVMVATSGSVLMAPDAMDALFCLMGHATVITPNLIEAQALTGASIESKQDMLSVAERLHERVGAAVLLKGGHFRGQVASDLLYGEGVQTWLEAPRIETANSHGTGCTLSSALASGLAQGLDLEAAARFAKDYITGALASGLDLGKGSGPVDHMWRYR